MPITIVNETVISSELNNTNYGSNDSFTITDEINKNDINNINKTTFFENIMITLEDRISDLKRQVDYLRNESNKKTLIINKLLSISNTSDAHHTNNRRSELFSSSSNLEDNNIVLHHPVHSEEGVVKQIYDKSFDTILNDLIKSPSNSPENNQYFSFPAIETDYTDTSRDYFHSNVSDRSIITPLPESNSSKNILSTSHDINTILSSTHNDNVWNGDNECIWERHSNGFATKMLKKMGYKGKSLGKN